MKTKTIRIPKRGGGSRLQRVQVLKSGKYKFIKNPSRSRARGGGSPSPRARRTKTKRKRRVMRTARRRRRRSRRSQGLTIPLAPVAGIAVGVAPAIHELLGGNLERAAQIIAYRYAGIGANGEFDPTGLLKGIAPVVVGALVHKFVGGPPLNVNRMLARAKVPVIRI